MQSHDLHNRPGEGDRPVDQRDHAQISQQKLTRQQTIQEQVDKQIFRELSRVAEAPATPVSPATPGPNHGDGDMVLSKEVLTPYAKASTTEYARKPSADVTAPQDTNVQSRRVRVDANKKLGLLDFICWVPWLCGVALTFVGVWKIKEPLQQSDADVVFIVFAYVVWGSYFLHKLIRDCTVSVVREICVRAGDGVQAQGFFTAALVTFWVIVQYMLLLPVSAISTGALNDLFRVATADNGMDEVLVNWALMSFLLTFFQWQVPSRAIALRYSITFLLLCAALMYVLAAGSWVPPTTELIAMVFRSRGQEVLDHCKSLPPLKSYTSTGTPTSVVRATRILHRRPNVRATRI